MHDWALTKGDPPSTVNSLAETASMSAVSTPSVEKILKKTLEDQLLTIVAESDLASPLLAEVVHGHRVNGAKVCTSYLYANIGLTLGKHLLDKYRSDLKGYTVDVHDMQVHKPLLLREDREGTCSATPFRVEVRYPINSTTASMSISSTASNGQTTKHADCELHLDDPSTWKAEWDRQAYLIRRSIDYLEQRADQGLDSMLATGMVYKIFSSLVGYHDGFKGL